MRWTVLAASLCLASAAHAGTLLFLNSQAGDYVGQGESRLITPADGTFTASRNFDNGVNIDFAGTAPGDSWSAAFAAPMSATLVAGAYEGATRWPFQITSVPGLSVYPDSRACNTSSGRFVVLEATYGPGGEVRSFAADFEQRCEPVLPTLLGSVRYQAGDPACAGQPDGAKCDDHDACTPVDVCVAGRCAGARAGDCAADPCRTGGLCDPNGGTCVGDTAVSCDDADPCTDDTCEVSDGCLSTPVPCWNVAGRAAVSGLGGIRDAPSVLHFTGVLVLRIDGTYRLPSTGITSCGAGIPDEVGTYRTGRRGRRLVLSPTNLDAIGAAASPCIGYSFSVTSYRTVVKFSRDGNRLHGISTLAAALEILGQSIPFHAGATLKGTRGP